MIIIMCLICPLLLLLLIIVRVGVRKGGPGATRMDWISRESALSRCSRNCRVSVSQFAYLEGYYYYSYYYQYYYYDCYDYYDYNYDY